MVPEPVTALAKKVVMQDMEETGLRMVKADQRTVKTRLVWQMLDRVKPRLHEHPSRQRPSRSFECTSRTFT